MMKNEQSLKRPLGHHKAYQHSHSRSSRRGEKEEEGIFYEIMAPKFANLIKNISRILVNSEEKQRGPY